jgi:fermentation-respiration switch protein FrsA (DUF1100 family)
MAYDNSSPAADKPLPPRVVYTRKNTPFDRWKEMVMACFAEKDHDPSDIRPLEFLHGWEDGATPDFFVDIYVRRRAKDISRGR